MHPLSHHTPALTLAALLLVGCASAAQIPHVADQAVIEIPDGRSAKPVQFKKIVVKLKRGEDIGSIQAGLACIPNAELVYRGGRHTLGGDELTEVFQDELKAANYEVVGDPDALFEDASTWKAEFLIAGLVKKMQANVCYPMAGFGDLVNSKGEAFMEVDWQVYSRLERDVVYRLTTQGRGKVDSAQPSAEVDIFLDAFAQATRNMLADKGFYELISGAGAVAPAATPSPTITVASKPLFHKPISDHMSDVRLNVITVFAGDGHGSGFYIDGSGYVMTNEHVVRTAQFVKVKLATGREVLGEVVTTDRTRDVALIETEATGIPGLPLRITRPHVGSEVYAVGSPLDKDFSTTVSRGIISAYRTEDGLDFIQSDVNILPGSSGGPLLDENGNVIGITVKGVFLEGAPAGLNFFVPISDALQRLGISTEELPRSTPVSALDKAE